MKVCPELNLKAVSKASLLNSSSFPSCLTRHLPEDSQKAKPNFMFGTEFTKASYISSTVFMKWLCPMIIFIPSGGSIFIDFNSNSISEDKSKN
jgi:hypothetical protein